MAAKTSRIVLYPPNSSPLVYDVDGETVNWEITDVPNGVEFEHEDLVIVSNLPFMFTRPKKELEEFPPLDQLAEAMSKL